jgi:predicted  nucleic acid-binding Zn-ribbon protein
LKSRGKFYLRRLEHQFAQQRHDDLKKKIEQVKLESSLLNQKAMELQNKKNKIEKNVQSEAQSMGNLIQEKERKVEELKFYRDSLLYKISRMNT